MQLPKHRHSCIPYIVLTGTLLLTSLAAFGTQRAAVQKDRLQFENAIQQSLDNIDNRLHTYIALLRAGSGFFAGSDNVNRQEFRTYVERIEIEQNYPGVQGLGFSARFSPEEKAALIADLQRQGIKNFKIRPESQRSEYHAIIYLEPLDRRNQVAIGFDMFTEPVRRAAMIRARDTGAPAASGRVTLVQEIDQKKQAGFIIYVPVYRHGVIPSTLTERQKTLRGFVYSPFRVDDLMKGIFGDEEFPLVDLQIYTGTTSNSANLLHSSKNQQLKTVGHPPRFVATRTLNVAGQPWTIVFTSRPELDSVSERRLVPYIWTAGIIISLVLFLVVRSQVRTLAYVRKSEAALRKSESRLRRLVDANIIGIIIGDTNGKIVEANNAFLNIIGYSREDVLADKVDWLQMTPPEYHHLDEQAAKEMILTGSHVPYEKEYIRKDGTRVPVLVGTALLEESSNMGVGFLLDLTEQKQAKAALQRTNERLTFLYSVSSSLLLYEEPKAFIKGLFSQLTNHLNLEVYFNYLLDADEQTLHLHAFDGVLPEVAQEIDWSQLGQVLWKDVVKERKPHIAENVQKSTDPALELVRSLGITAYTCYPLLAREQIIGVLCFGTRNRHYFTSDELILMQVVCDQIATALERSRLLAELQRQTEELKQANRMKDEFLATLSHELRTPLTSMLGWTNLLRTRKFNEETTARALESIDRNTQSLTQLIEDILDVSRIITGKLHLKMQPMRLLPVIEAAIDTVRPAAEAKQIQIESSLDSSLGYVLGDTTRLQQVVWNLLTNAIKFTPNGGRVEVRLEMEMGQGALGIGHRASGNGQRAWVKKPIPNSQFPIPNSQCPIPNAQFPMPNAQITVSDTGSGISPEFLPHVFDRFCQEDGKITRAHGGLGLGLAIARHLVELHNGTVKAESAGEGQGATFIIRLPLLTHIPNQRDKQSLTPEAYRRQVQEAIVHSGEFDKLRSLDGICILVVDDEADAREFIATTLSQAGAEVITASNAKQAFELLQHQQPDVLISDIGMPGEDGYTFIRKVRKLDISQGGKIPAIALTAYAKVEDSLQAIQAGFQKHIPKPVHPDNLTAIVADLVNG